MSMSLLTDWSGEKAILFAGNEADAQAPWPQTLHGALQPLQGKHLLQRAVERLVRHGLHVIEVVLDDHAPQVRAFLGDGRRWGCRITCHYRSEQDSLPSFMRSIGVLPVGHYWLADARYVPDDCLPQGRLAPAAGHPLCWQEGTRKRWSGWGRFGGAWLLSQDIALDSETLAARVLADEWLFQVPIRPPLSAASPRDLLDSARRLLSALPDGTVTVGRGCRIDAGALLVSPVTIGDNVRIEAGAIVGPDVLVEPGCFIGKNAIVSASVVGPETYVGDDLELEAAVVRGNLLMNTSLGAVTEVADADLLADLSARPHTNGILLRLTAWLLFGLLFPVRFVLAALAGLRDHAAPRPLPLPRADRQRAEPGAQRLAVEPLHASVTDARLDWIRHFCYTFHPGLREVGRGRLALVGPALRSLAEVHSLPPEWRRLYAQAPCGLLNEALAAGCPPLEADEQFAADALAVAAQHDWHQAARYTGRYLMRIAAIAWRLTSPPYSHRASRSADAH